MTYSRNEGMNGDLLIELATTIKINLGGDHEALFTRMCRVIWRIIELAANRVGALVAVPGLVDKVLARAVLEHVRSAGVALGPGSLFALGAGEERVVGGALHDGNGRFDGGGCADESGERHEDGKEVGEETHGELVVLISEGSRKVS